MIGFLSNFNGLTPHKFNELMVCCAACPKVSLQSPINPFKILK